MKESFVFLINENSGSGKSLSNAAEAQKTISSSSVQSTAPVSPEELSKVCIQLEPAQTKAAVVFGGDGTQNFALRGLIENGIPLYPFPSGTANDLANEYGITGCINQFKNLIQQDSVEEINVLSVNGVPFSTVGGIGIGSALCAEYNRMRTRFKFLKKIFQRVSCEIYSLLAIKQVIANWGKGHRVRIKGDSFQRELTVSSLMVCNQSTLAGNLRVAPEQNKNSEEFTVLIHPEPCGFSTLRGLAGLKAGNIDRSFISFKTKNLEVEFLNEKENHVFGDGEILTAAKKLVFRRYPKKLKIYSAH
jgi:diacylglycerol kinase family enzyme